jgi:hypothetical protein
MAIKLPSDLSSEEIRVLQEYRRLGTAALALDAIKSIKHPAGGVDGEVSAAGLVAKGFLEATGTDELFSLTEKGKAFLAVEPRPGGAAADVASSAGEESHAEKP